MVVSYQSPCEYLWGIFHQVDSLFLFIFEYVLSIMVKLREEFSVIGIHCLWNNCGEFALKILELMSLFSHCFLFTSVQNNINLSASKEVENRPWIQRNGVNLSGLDMILVIIPQCCLSSKERKPRTYVFPENERHIQSSGLPRV